MKINKTYLELKGEKVTTYLTIYFEGNKEEVSVKNNSIYIWCKDEDDFEFWIKLDVLNKELFIKYLKNQETILNIIKSSNITLFKREYDAYHTLEYLGKIEYKDLYTKEFILPNEKAKLGYDFYSLYRSHLQIPPQLPRQGLTYSKK